MKHVRDIAVAIVVVAIVLAVLAVAGCVSKDVAIQAAREAGIAAVDRAIGTPRGLWAETAVGSLGAIAAIVGHRYWFHKRGK